MKGYYWSEVFSSTSNATRWSGLSRKNASYDKIIIK